MPQSSLEGVITFVSWSLPPYSPSKCPGLDPPMNEPASSFAQHLETRLYQVELVDEHEIK